MIEEIWKDIGGYEGLYQISNMGRVKSLSRVRKGNKGVTTIVHEKILKLKNKKGGYLGVSLSKENTPTNFEVHRLVAKAFIPNPDNLPEVNHKDEVKTNNCVDNLEWCDRKYNCNYGTRNERIIKTQTKPVISLKENNIVMYFTSLAEAQQKGFSAGAISDCCNNKPKHKTHKGFKWQYVEDYLADWWDKEMDKYMEKEKAA